MAATDTALLGQMHDDIVDGKHRDATEAFFCLVASSHDIPELVTGVTETASPSLHVPARHILLPNGAFRHVNYDHTMLGIRAGMCLMPSLASEETSLTLTQAVWYVPPGLNVWEQPDGLL